MGAKWKSGRKYDKYLASEPKVRPHYSLFEGGSILSGLCKIKQLDLSGEIDSLMMHFRSLLNMF